MVAMVLINALHDLVNNFSRIITAPVGVEHSLNPFQEKVNIYI